MEYPKWVELKTMSGTELPEWAEFFRCFGEGLATDSATNESWHIFTMPNSRMASSLLGIGFLSKRFLDRDFHRREKLESLSKGDQISWLSHDRQSLKHGYFDSVVTSILDSTRRTFKYLDSERGAVTSRQTEFFDTYRFSKYEGEPFKRPRLLSSNLEFLDAFAPNIAIEIATKSSSEICFIGDTEIRSDLLANEFSCSGHSGCPDDILRVRALDDVGESPHFLSLYANPASRTLSEISTKLALYDGSSAVRKQINYVNAPISVVILDRWDNHSREVFAALKNIRMRSRGIETKLATDLKLPKGMEYLGWGAIR